MTYAVDAVDGPLSEEIKEALSEIRLGRSRADALKAVGERTNHPALRNALRVVTQAEKLGANISKLLNDLAADARHQRLMLVEEMAAKLPVKMVFPMVFFMIPAIVIDHLRCSRRKLFRHSTMIVALLVALFFGSDCVHRDADEHERLQRHHSRAHDGPRVGKPPYVLLLIAAAAALGAFLAYRSTPPVQLGIAAIVIFALVACWCSDALCGFLPDAFTLAPLAALLLFSIAQHDWEVVISAVIVFVPFAIAAIFSKGYGMGWGDAEARRADRCGAWRSARLPGSVRRVRYGGRRP